MEKETLSLPDIVDTLGQRPFPLKENIQEYLHELRERKATQEPLEEEKSNAEVDKETTENKEDSETQKS